MSFDFHIIGEYLAHHPMIGFLFAFFIAMIESIAVIGSLIPGAVTMTLVGTLIGSGILPFSTTLIICILGALTGDFLSYWFGIRYRDHIYQMWPFSKYTKIVKMGENFFEKHGGKSIVIGRFIGPVRSMLPLIAGVLQMKLLPFSFAAFVSATAWSIVYLFPGIFLGAISMELPKAKAGQFLAYVLLWIFLIWLGIWVTQYLIRKSWRYIDYFLEVCWHALKAHPKAAPLLQFIVNPKDPHDHRQFTLLISGLTTFLFFLWISESVYVHGFLTELDLPVFDLLQSFRTVFLDRVMSVISFLGDYHALLIAAIIIFLIFLYKRAFWIALHWLGITLFIALATKSIKWLIHAKRPELYFQSDIFSSFPSGHVSISFALFGFAAVLISTELTNKWRKLPYWLVTFLILMIAFSRIYLGVHWLSDVVGAFFLSLTCTLLLTVSYRRRLNHILSAQFLITILSIIFISCISVYGVMHQSQIYQTHKLVTPIENMSLTQWWKEPIQLPLYRKNRLGIPTEPLNISWVGNIDTIRKTLLEKGWIDEQAGISDIKTLVFKNLLKPQEDFRLPLFSSLYRNQPPQVIMTRRVGTDWIVLELWPSGILISEKNNRPLVSLWIGVIYTLPHPHKWFSYNKKEHKFKDAIDFLSSDINHLNQTQIIHESTSKMPEKIKKLFSGPTFKMIKVKSLELEKKHP